MDYEKKYYRITFRHHHFIKNNRHLILFLTTLALLLQGCSESSMNGENARKLSDLVRTYDCPMATGAVTIDGKLDEETWKHALKIDRFYNKFVSTDPESFAPASTQAVAYLAWDNKNLYLAADIEDMDIVSGTKGRDAILWRQDVLEIFIKPQKDSFHYYELEFSPYGDILDIFWPSRALRSQFATCVKWNADISCVAKAKGTINNWRDKDEGWTVEVSIPLAAFSETTQPPKPGDTWTFTIAKSDHSRYLERHENSVTAEGLKLQKLTGAGFHEYEYYDQLRFVKK